MAGYGLAVLGTTTASNGREAARSRNMGSRRRSDRLAQRGGGRHTRRYDRSRSGCERPARSARALAQQLAGSRACPWDHRAPWPLDSERPVPLGTPRDEHATFGRPRGGIRLRKRHMAAHGYGLCVRLRPQSGPRAQTPATGFNRAIPRHWSQNHDAPPAVEGVGRRRLGSPFATGRGSVARAGLNVRCRDLESLFFSAQLLV